MQKMQIKFATSLVFTGITLANGFLDSLPNMLYASWSLFFKYSPYFKIH